MRTVKVATPQVGDDEISAVGNVLRSGCYVSGPRVEEFERAFANYVGAAHAIAVNSGTAALHAAIDAAGIQPGDEVIVPALTFFATVSAVIHQGAVPVFADISPQTYSLCPNDLRRRITSRTKAVIPVHYFGHAAEMDGILETAGENGLIVIEDCAQSHGTTYRGKMTGSIGDMGAFSFFATKHITTGEGGMVATDNENWAERMRMFRSHGMSGRDDHVILGYNYRMTEMAAAIGQVQLNRLDELNTRRRDVSYRILDSIRDVDWVTVPTIPNYVEHSFFWCHIGVREDVLGMTTRDLVPFLRERGVEVRNRYWEPLYRQPLLNEAIPPILRLAAGDNLPDYGALKLENVEKLAGRVIGLPNRPDMSDDEIDHVIGVIREIG